MRFSSASDDEVGGSIARSALSGAKQSKTATMTRVTTILSIQSSVAYGYVGNSAVTFPLMRMGVKVWPVITVHFSNHTGYGSWRGPLLSAVDLRDVVLGIDERGVLGEVDAVLSGYLGGEDIAAMILDAVALVKLRNPAAIYCCDPVLGDADRGYFVRPGIPELMRQRVVPAAQIITPNQFELEALTGLSVSTLAEVLGAADAAAGLGPEVVLVTSVLRQDGPPGTIDMVAVTADGAWLVTTPRLPQTFTGSGDVTAATFLAGLLSTGDVPGALAHTAAVIYGLLAVTAASGGTELALITAQDELVRPSHTFEPVRLR
jgi:pyridoxine kinase